MLSVIILGISLSLDAFSLALCFGTLNFTYRKMFLISLTVGIFHFFMPLLGIITSDIILKLVLINPKYIAFLVFVILGIFMIINKEESICKLSSLISIISFAFAVSIDSYVAGIGLNLIYSNHIVSSLIFTIISSLFTMSGLLLGKYINNKVGNISKIIGGVTLILFSLQFLK